MEKVITADWHENVFIQHPSLRASYEKYLQRKKENRLELYEKCRLGEIIPSRVYDPPNLQENSRCEFCGDIGYRFYWQDGYQVAEPCECLNRIQSEYKMKKSGVNRDLTFENFYTDKNWQTDIAAKGYEYATGWHLTGQWFFIGGQVGCGKTHLCTAIVNEILKTNIACRYMAWREESTQLKSLINEHEEYHERIMELKNTPVLYIDDFFKTQQGKLPTQADVNLAFEILNYRYQDKQRRTIISCERSVDDIIKIDEAIGSRIYERSKAYRIFVGKDNDKNYRLSMG